MTKEIRCNNTGCNCTEEERATNNGNCKHAVVVYGEVIYVTKDSGKRVNYESGFTRDTDTDKPRYDLIPLDMLTRLAELYTRGAKKYGENNWQKACTKEEFARFQQSAFRHFIQWLSGDVEEDHACGVVFNIFAYEHLKNKNK